ncbi:MAG: hypothetical protein M1834_002108 [Cirrosporium novae-zelandiae]|nr:MAG: hypothetical protein M1834_002108 [Cirrosporium novae-zelandiae]
MFQLASSEKQEMLHNLVTGSVYPTSPYKDPIETLKAIGMTVDEDFLILLESEDGDQYVLEAFVNCYPSGFDTREKFGKKLRDIHTPVPGYKAKLEKSMDRFFSRLEVGRIVRRVNWSITTHTNLFSPSGNHLYEGEEIPDASVDISQTRLRVERQTLHRLPETKALVFGFHTYLYPISDVKEEGSGEVLAEAIDGLRTGSVSQMWFYKRGVVWGKEVKEYLRGE